MPSERVDAVPQGPQLVVMAAGMGSRFGGPKQLEPLGPAGETIPEYSAFDALRHGFSEIVFIVREEIDEAFRSIVGRHVERRIATRYVRQSLDDLPPGYEPPRGRDKPWGTAHALWSCRDVLDRPFAVINADDFYGEGAFRALGEFLSRSATASGRYCMVGYQLDETLSPHGEVSRGVCATSPDGMLEGIVETSGIRRDTDGISCAGPGGERRELAADSVVSMNVWGFSPDFLGHLDSALVSFLAEHASDRSAECYLPEVVGQLLRADRASVQVLRADTRWFGLTNRQDLPDAKGVIAELVAAGAYPGALWGQSDGG
jgi:hypothetical protein